MRVSGIEDQQKFFFHQKSKVEAYLLIYLEKDFKQTVFISYFFGKIYHTQINFTLSTKYCSVQVKPSDFGNGFLYEKAQSFIRLRPFLGIV